MEVFDKFTTRLKSTLVRAAVFAAECGASFIFPEHLLWALGTERGSIGTELLSRNKFAVKNFEEFLLAKNKPSALAASGKLELGKESRDLVLRAVRLAAKENHKFIGTEHLLFTLLESEIPQIVNYFTAQKINVKTVKRHTEMVLKNVGNFPDIINNLPAKFDLPRMSSNTALKEKQTPTRKTPALDSFGQDLTRTDIAEKLDPLIGREKELERVMEILLRRTKNNPVLLGEPGVGKTAIVEGLAQRIARKDIPIALLDKRIISLDLGLVVAGTIYRGEFEERMKAILEEAIKNPDIILFIDEIHALVGAGSASGSLDAAGILKPALSRGEIRVIGATTYADYKKFIEADGALERRFEPVTVSEPTRAEALQILSGLRANYEKFHGVKISDEALEAAADLSIRYITDRNLPDKAIDLIDEAGSAKRLEASSVRLLEQMRALTRRAESIVRAKNKAVMDENYNEAVRLKRSEERIIQEIKNIRTKIANLEHGLTVSSNDVARTVAKKKGLVIPELDLDLGSRTQKLLLAMREKIIGQDDILEKIVGLLARAGLGISSALRPIASFLFLGPSGVGKTFTAEILAKKFFGSPQLGEDGSREGFIHLDMSEFSESFQISKLIGAPAGYVGYRESNKLTDCVKNHPYSLILFDEIEKAHPDVLNILLQILDSGELTDASGRAVNFKNTIIIMTSNVGTNELGARISGFGASRQDGGEWRASIIDAAKREFKKELLGRFDEVCVFNQLKIDDLTQIIRLETERLFAITKKQAGCALDITPLALKFLANLSQDAALEAGEFGARKIKKIIRDKLELPLAEFILKNRAARLTIGARGGRIIIYRSETNREYQHERARKNKEIELL